MSQVFLSLSVASASAVTHAAYSYGLPGEKGSQPARVSFVDAEGNATPLVARLGQPGKGRGQVVSYTLYARFPENIARTVNGMRALMASDYAKGRAADRRPQDEADYLFQISPEEYRDLRNGLEARVEASAMPAGGKVGVFPGIAIPTRVEISATEVGNTPIDEAEETEAKPVRARRRVAKAE